MAYTIKIQTGLYTGNGAALQVVTCDGPSLVFVKRITGASSLNGAMWKGMPRNASNSPGGTEAVKAARITDLTKDGFWVGAGQNQNGSVYAYVALKAVGVNKFFRVGRYLGNGVDDRSILMPGAQFTPDFVGVSRRVDGMPPVFRTSAHVGDSAQTYTGATQANYIQALLNGGFQIGTNANVNFAGDVFDWIALRRVPSGLEIGSFTGTGAPQSVDFGFAPTAVFVKNQNTSDPMVQLTAGMVTTGSGPLPMSAAVSDPQSITALTSTGFTVGAATSCNGLGNKITFIAFRDGEYTPAGAR